MSCVSPASDQLKDRPNLGFGKLVHQVMQFSTHRAHAASIEAAAREGRPPSGPARFRSSRRGGPAGVLNPC